MCTVKRGSGSPVKTCSIDIPLVCSQHLVYGLKLRMACALWEAPAGPKLGVLVKATMAH